MAHPATADRTIPASILPAEVSAVRDRLLREHGLSVEPATARYLARRLEADDEEILSFPASDVASGEWAFRVLSAAVLRGH